MDHRLTPGLMLIAIGVIFLLDNLGVIQWRQWWPMILIAIGISMLFQPSKTD